MRKKRKKKEKEIGIEKERDREQKGWRSTTTKRKNIVLSVLLLGHVRGYFLDMYADNSFFIVWQLRCCLVSPQRKLQFILSNWWLIFCGRRAVCMVYRGMVDTTDFYEDGFARHGYIFSLPAFNLHSNFVHQVLIWRGSTSRDKIGVPRYVLIWFMVGTPRMLVTRSL